jgi:hypothetical protein
VICINPAYKDKQGWSNYEQEKWVFLKSVDAGKESIIYVYCSLLTHALSSGEIRTSRSPVAFMKTNEQS